jgi:hypothetical protein
VGRGSAGAGLAGGSATRGGARGRARDAPRLGRRHGARRGRGGRAARGIRREGEEGERKGRRGENSPPGIQTPAISSPNPRAPRGEREVGEGSYCAGENQMRQRD